MFPPTTSHSQGAPLIPSSSREPPQTQAYRQAAASPPQRPSVLTYGHRQGPPTPVQSPAASLNVPPPRQPPGPGSSFNPIQHPSTSPHPMASQLHHNHSNQQSYQQHVQAMVSGAHQQQSQQVQRPPVSLGPGPGGVPYGHRTPPPPSSATQASRTGGLGGPPQSLVIGRSFTPPSAMHQSPTTPLNGLPYSTGGPSAPHISHHPYPRHPGPSQASGPNIDPSVTGHRRIYSQSSGSGPLPGPLNPPR